jgi:aminomethyltransferase
MPLKSPFHERTQKHCESYRWKNWAGYHAVCSFDTCHEREYFAFRNSVGMIDVTPLFKYEVTGPDATNFLNWIITKDISKLKPKQVSYCCWCDDDGTVVDDGTVTRLEENRYMITAAEPTLGWFLRNSYGFNIEIKDTTKDLAALSIQGPLSKILLNKISDQDLDELKFFYSTNSKFDGFDGLITRTGYTGDLGYEIWVKNNDAIKLWDLLIKEGNDYGIEPCGLDALDVTRIEAGFIMNGVDYTSSNHCMINARKRTPYELGLGWTVKLDKDPFLGQKALINAKKSPEFRFRGLDINWEKTVELFAELGLPPELPHGAWRTPVPIYKRNSNTQIGRATSGSWSPILKKNLALSTIQTEEAEIGETVDIELTVEYERKRVPAVISKTPFFDPPRKRG